MVDQLITAAQFRTDFPAFADPNAYPDSQINFWARVAQQLVNPVWGSSTELAEELFIAHNVALEAQAALGASAGGVPGVNVGIVASQSAGALSVSYDTSGALEANAGHWALTIYGSRLIRLARLFGKGPVQVAGLMTGWQFFSGGLGDALGFGILAGPGWQNSGWGV